MEPDADRTHELSHSQNLNRLTGAVVDARPFHQVPKNGVSMLIGHGIAFAPRRAAIPRDEDGVVGSGRKAFELGVFCIQEVFIAEVPQDTIPHCKSKQHGPSIENGMTSCCCRPYRKVHTAIDQVSLMCCTYPLRHRERYQVTHARSRVRWWPFHESSVRMTVMPVTSPESVLSIMNRIC